MSMVRHMLGKAALLGLSLIILTGFAGPAFAGGGLPTPEIDPGSIASAMTLLSGGMLILADRRQRSR